MSNWELAVVEVMERQGGAFLRALAAAYFAADPENRWRIRETWHEEWGKYEAIAHKAPRREEELV